MKRNRIILACLSIATTLMAVGCSAKTPDTQIEDNVIQNSTSVEDTTIVETTEESTTTEEVSTPGKINSYATRAAWQAPSHYMCAVEVEGFDGDNLKNGVYHLYSEKLYDVEGQKTAAWEIYVTKDVVYDMGLLENTDVSFQGRVGGEGNEEVILVLDRGYYVYVKSLHTENTHVTSQIIINKADS